MLSIPLAVLLHCMGNFNCNSFNLNIITHMIRQRQNAKDKWRRLNDKYLLNYKHQLMF